MTAPGPSDQTDHADAPTEAAETQGPARDAAQASRHAFDPRMLEALVCPSTRGPLIYDAERMELQSRAAGLAFPIRNGVPVMLIDEARDLE